MTTMTPTSTSEEKAAMLRPEDLAVQLGVAVPTVQNYCRQGRIRSVKVGKLVRIPRDEYERVLREGVPPQ